MRLIFLTDFSYQTSREPKIGISDKLKSTSCQNEIYMVLNKTISQSDVLCRRGGGRGKTPYQLKINDFAATTDSTGHLYIFMPNDELTKNHQDNPNAAEGRMHAIKGEYVLFELQFL